MVRGMVQVADPQGCQSVLAVGVQSPRRNFGWRLRRINNLTEQESLVRTLSRLDEEYSPICSCLQSCRDEVLQELSMKDVKCLSRILPLMLSLVGIASEVPIVA
jgi:hypothetical protein